MSDIPPMVRMQVDGQWVSGIGSVSMNVALRGGGTLRVLAEAIPQRPKPPLEVDATEMVDAIVAAIKRAPDSFVEAGKWITAVTNAATQSIREDDKP